MDSLVNEICDYIEFLRKSQGLQVTLHPNRNNLAITTNAQLMKYNLHYNPYCLYLKTSSDMWNTCIHRQKKVNARAALGEFCGTCHAGVLEFIYPILNREQPGGFISVGGYHGGKLGEAKSKQATVDHALDREILTRLYRGTLHQTVPDKPQVDTLLRPLVRMLELLSLKRRPAEETPGMLAYFDVLQYINRHYTTKLTVEQVAQKLHYSVSHISHLFKSNSGMSISDYLNTMRIETAKDMLRHSDASIESTALACGFGDASYFSYVFKKLTGVSPRQYRTSQ